MYGHGGGGVARDPYLETTWLRLAAESGEMWSQETLAERHFAGTAAALDPEEGLQWLLEAARSGLSWVPRKLLDRYRQGELPPGLDLEAALAELRGIVLTHRGAGSHDAALLSSLAEIPPLGMLPPSWLAGERSDEAIAEYVQLSVKLDYWLAHRTLGELHELGRGVTQDAKKALRSYERAAEWGDPVARAAIRRLTPGTSPMS